jgi:hypothetical protein
MIQMDPTSSGDKNKSENGKYREKMPTRSFRLNGGSASIYCPGTDNELEPKFPGGLSPMGV